MSRGVAPTPDVTRADRHLRKRGAKVISPGPFDVYCAASSAVELQNIDALDPVTCSDGNLDGQAQRVAVGQGLVHIAGRGLLSFATPGFAEYAQSLAHS